MALKFTGPVLPDGEARTLYVVDGKVTYDERPGADTVASGWIVPGLVDAHCHLGLDDDGAVDEEETEAQAIQDRDAGALLIRDCGSAADTAWIHNRDDLPRLIRAGRHIARTKRYIRNYAHEVEPGELAAQVAIEAQRGDGWVKLVGDWISRDDGDLSPSFPAEAFAEAIAVAHVHGAKVTAHCFGHGVLPGLIDAGIDCIEHGTGLTDDTIELMVQHGTALVPTLINIENFPGIADAAEKYATYARHIRDLHATCYPRIGAAREAGIPIYAGTDAGTRVAHGRIADEIEALKGIGMSPTEALGVASWTAREWLGRPGLEHGAPADLVCYLEDPRSGPEVINDPDAVILRGRVF
jgi:imidazolonepropionase-like amidohydrolase